MVMASSATSNLFNTISMADACLVYLPYLSAAKTTNPFSQFPPNPLSSTSPTLPLRSSCRNGPFGTDYTSVIAFVAQTSNWVQEDNAFTIDGAKGSEEERVFEERDEELNVKPLKEVKMFVGNLAFGVDNQKLAELFERLELSRLLLSGF